MICFSYWVYKNIKANFNFVVNRCTGQKKWSVWIPRKWWTYNISAPQFLINIGAHKGEKESCWKYFQTNAILCIHRAFLCSISSYSVGWQVQSATCGDHIKRQVSGLVYIQTVQHQKLATLLWRQEAGQSCDICLQHITAVQFVLNRLIFFLFLWFLIFCQL